MDAKKVIKAAIGAALIYGAGRHRGIYDCYKGVNEALVEHDLKIKRILWFPALKKCEAEITKILKEEA